jgi:Zn-dependent peptidase ImmA (M78 family)
MKKRKKKRTLKQPSQKMLYKELLKDFIEVFSEFERKEAIIVRNDNNPNRTIGLYVPHQKTIYLNPLQDHYKRRHVLVHEFIHAVRDRKGLDNSEGIVDEEARKIIGELWK